MSETPKAMRRVAIGVMVVIGALVAVMSVPRWVPHAQRPGTRESAPGPAAAQGDEMRPTPPFERPHSSPKQTPDLDGSLKDDRVTNSADTTGSSQAPRGMPDADAVAIATGVEAAERGYPERIEAVRHLGRSLSEREITTLMGFLDRPLAQETTLSPRGYNALKNGIVNVLLAQDQIPPGLGSALLRMHQDVGNDLMWRDYCLQFLAQYYRKRWTPHDTSDQDPEREQVAHAIKQALETDGGAFAGTALLGLEDLSRSYREFDPALIRGAAVRTAGSPEGTEANRITALRVCALLNAREILPVARDTALGNGPSMLRMAAVAMLADLGDPEDLDLLISLTGDRDPRVSRSAHAATNKWAQRPGDSSTQ